MSRFSMDYRKRLENALHNHLIDRTWGAHRWAFIVLLLLTVGAALLVIQTGTPVLTKFGHVLFVPLDGAWRILNGQRPHVDFYSPFGVVNFLIPLLGMLTAKPTSQAICYGNALVFMVVVFWGWFLAIRRMRAALAWPLALFIGATFAAPIGLGEPFFQTSFSSLFNRYASGFALLLMIELFCPAFESTLTENWQDRITGGISTGILLVVLFFSKMNYFAFGCVSLAVSLCFYRRDRAWFGSFGAAAVVTLVLFLAFLRFDLQALAHDYYFATRTKIIDAPHVRRTVWGFVSQVISPEPDKLSISRALGVLRLNFFVFLAFGALYFALPFESARFKLTSKRTTPYWALPALIIALNLAVVFTNHQNEELSMVIALGFIMFELGLRSPERVLPPRCAAAALFLVFLCGPTFFNDLAAIVYGAAAKATMRREMWPGYQFKTEPLDDLVIMQTTGACAIPFGARYNNAVDLLERRGPSDMRLTVFDYSNPFSFGMRLQSPRGGVTNFGYPITYSDQAVPPTRLFADTNAVLVPKCPDWPLASTRLLEAHKRILENEFAKPIESDYWRLYIRSPF